MSSTAVSQHVAHIAGVRADASSTASAIESALVAARKVRSWVDAHEAALVSRLSELSSFPAAAIADAGRCSLHDAHRTKERADTLAHTPRLAGALDDGDITARHIDAVTRGAKRLDDERRREELFERLDDLVDVAAAATAEQFERRIKSEIRKLHSDDGDDRLTRQRRDVRLTSWTDAEGMWNLRGRFDPLSGVGLAAALDRTVQRLFAESTPELCPSDAIEKQRFLAGHALARLVTGTLDLGRSTRLASSDQRRALRAMYRSCAIPGCGVRFDRCKVHHIVWWRHGGHTDLANLLPVCVEHHSRIHRYNFSVTTGRSSWEAGVNSPYGSPTARSAAPGRRVDG